MTPNVPPTAPLRELSDARTIRALAHPVRLALLDALHLEGPLTATQAGEYIGESPTTCSFHLRQLAKYGFVEEAGGGKGRSRPWRRTSEGLRYSSDHDDPETELAAQALARLSRERELGRLQTWLETSQSYPREWRDAAAHGEFVMWMTPQELAELNDELVELLRPRFYDRRFDPQARPAGALPVELLLFNYPMSPPQGGGA
jgi:DNA-binding transcriptional ArsR family regulator